MAPKIKWPNDVLLNGKKTAGILAEAHWSGEHLRALILGIGINVASDSVPPVETINFPATCVEAELGRDVRVSELLRAVLEQLIAWRSHLNSPEFIQAWQSRLAYLEQKVRLNMGPGKVIDAQLQGLAADGSLRLRLPSGELGSYRMGEIQITPID
jgi:BirA family biotin operon repressor/biotin-[acetyl-CoA-carboxylase] ligase